MGTLPHAVLRLLASRGRPATSTGQDRTSKVEWRVTPIGTEHHIIVAASVFFVLHRCNPSFIKDIIDY